MILYSEVRYHANGSKSCIYLINERMDRFTPFRYYNFL